MSLATRCTSCGTVFRVVQDQLKVSEGWVRCGRCNEVFNALEGLFDMERDAPADWSGPVATPPPATASPAAVESGDAEEHRDPSLVDKIDAQLLSPRRSGFGMLASLAPAERRHEDFADARFDTDLPPETGGSSDLSIGPASTEPEGATSEDAATPEFIRQAEDQERWRSSGARVVLSVACGVLTLALGVQLAHHFRDPIAAKWPALQPALATWCDLAACRLEAPRGIEDVSLESSALTRVAAAPEAFQLSVVLRNRASSALALPWVDLSLTDAAGQLVARRALGPRDFHVMANALPAGSELPLQLTLSAGSGVAGYTVEIFYP